MLVKGSKLDEVGDRKLRIEAPAVGTIRARGGAYCPVSSGAISLAIVVALVHQFVASLRVWLFLVMQYGNTFGARIRYGDDIILSTAQLRPDPMNSILALRIAELAGADPSLLC